MENIKNLDRQTILEAISRIEKNPEIRNGRESTTYDLFLTVFHTHSRNSQIQMGCRKSVW